MNKKAVVLVSGGLDSATVVAMAQDMGFAVYALTLNYGQRNDAELISARAVTSFLKVSGHQIIDLDLRVFGGSSLTDSIEVKAHNDAVPSEIPSTYVPARNTIMLSLALAYSEVVGANDIFYGANVHDYSGYPDCRPEYVQAFEAMANLATKASTLGHRLKIHAPLVGLTKAEIIATGAKLGVDYGLTLSCYDPQKGLACGHCSACFYRRKGFTEASVLDPTVYLTPSPAPTPHAPT
jgi:7-cyano-7-deazaguanine synthase